MFPLLLLAFVLGVTGVTLIAAILSIAPWVPTRKRDFERIFSLAELQEGETFYDFGSGSGTVVFAAAKMTKANPIGVEMSWLMYLISQVRRLFPRHRHAKFLLKNAHAVDLADIDVLYIFGMPGRFSKLKAKLEREAPKGLRLISYAFPIEGLEHDERHKPTDEDLPIYLYRF